MLAIERRWMNAAGLLSRPWVSEALDTIYTRSREGLLVLMRTTRCDDVGTSNALESERTELVLDGAARAQGVLQSAARHSWLREPEH